ncbi:ClpP family protease [Nocardioides sp. GCM10030258]|uniref:ClpP family protease n=1 Tax=unclassified Nocardioides TaxID=2615069 RepID=UPI0036075BDD
MRSLLEELLATHTGRTPLQVREDTERDLVLTAQAAVDYGLVDAVITQRGTPGPSAYS